MLTLNFVEKRKKDFVFNNAKNQLLLLKTNPENFGKKLSVGKIKKKKQLVILTLTLKKFLRQLFQIKVLLVTHLLMELL